jgi:hypothetical protein
MKTIVLHYGRDSTIHLPTSRKQQSPYLVKILPGTFTDAVACDLIQEDFWHSHDLLRHDEPNYEALSYVWGDVSLKRPIHLNGQPFLVTTNLYSALCHLRWRNEVRTMWIDAICINQHDNAERTSQVQIMGDIYRAARRVVVWLGELDQDTEAAIKLMDTICDAIRSLDLDADGISLNIITGEWLQNPALLAYLDSSFIPSWRSFSHVLQREWWQRARIVQEFIFARDVVFLICVKSILRESLLPVVKFMYEAVSENLAFHLEITKVPGWGAIQDAHQLIFDRERHHSVAKIHDMNFDFLLAA